ncbi:Lrp/AsnC family transcriptional regulator [Nocardia sp. GCM10030253]|uniref:Lrp/AsnC family transcriptional regulator n=1 Tax=Nocardia sp. GCM10030253 TaxID=3273404 RepID=UPI0036309081
MESDTHEPLDALDLQLLHALQIDGRASFSRIAEVLGVSDRTVARRYERLRAAGKLRVTGATDSDRSGAAEWVVRMRVLPHGTDALAHSLARRPDTAWVTTMSSGTEIACVFRVPDGGSVPLAALARHPQVRDVTAQQLLAQLMDGRWRGRTSALTGTQIDALRPPYSDEAAAVSLIDLDRALVPALAVDGRASYPELARRLGWSESAVRRRLEELRRAQVLRLEVEVDPVVFGYSAQCVLWLTVAPAQLTEVARTLAADDEVAFIGATTGAHNLIVITVLRDSAALATYLTDRISALNGVERMEATPVTSYTKRTAPRH